MLTGAHLEVGLRFRTPLGRMALAGVALGVTVAACHRSRPAPAPPAEKAATPAESAAAPPAPRGKQIVVAYSSNILGEYEPCG